MSMKINVLRLDKDIELVKYVHKGDAAFDLRASVDMNVEKEEKVLVSTGIKIAIPFGYAGFIWDRSGLAVKNSLHCLAGVIDSSYRGEVKVVLINLSKEKFYIKKGMRIAQMVIQKVENSEITEVEKLPDTSRGEGGFGSTGLH